MIRRLQERSGRNRSRGAIAGNRRNRILGIEIQSGCRGDGWRWGDGGVAVPVLLRQWSGCSRQLRARCRRDSRNSRRGVRMPSRTWSGCRPLALANRSGLWSCRRCWIGTRGCRWKDRWQGLCRGRDGSGCVSDCGRRRAICMCHVSWQGKHCACQQRGNQECGPTQSDCASPGETIPYDLAASRDHEWADCHADKGAGSCNIRMRASTSSITESGVEAPAVRPVRFTPANHSA